MAQQEKFRYRGLDEAAQELLKDTIDAFEALPNREAQIEHILDAMGITEIAPGRRRQFFEDLMTMDEPNAHDLKYETGENENDYLTRAKNYFDNIKGFTITNMYERGGETSSLAVLSAPKAEGDPWGFINMNKQQGVVASNHLFRRVGTSHESRLRRTIERLNDTSLDGQGCLLWLGASGIGKSLSLVDILVKLVRSLQPGRYVGFFRNDTFTIYSKKGTELRKRQISVAFEPFKKLKLRSLAQDLIILVDPEEIVKDYDPPCSTLIAVSTHLEEDDLPSFFKAGPKLLLVDPPSRREVVAMATCVSADVIDPVARFKMIMDRYGKVGANLGVIMEKDDRFYTSLLEKIEKTRDFDLIKEARELNPMNIPKCFKYFIAPYNDTDLKEENQSAIMGKFHAWSDFSAEKLRKLAESSDKGKLMKMLNDVGLPYVVEENYIQSCLKEGAVGLQDWEWYENVAMGTEVASKAASPPTLCFTKVVPFQGRYFRTDVSRLEENTLYKSSGWQMVLGDFFIVRDKAGNGGGKIVYMIQVSSRDPKDHPFKMEQYENWRESLQMGEQDEMVIIYATNKTHTKLHGLTFKLGDAEGNAPCTAFIVRALMTPGAESNNMKIDKKDDLEAGWTRESPTDKKLGANWEVMSKPRGKKRKNKEYQVWSPPPTKTRYTTLKAAQEAYAASAAAAPSAA